MVRMDNVNALPSLLPQQRDTRTVGNIVNNTEWHNIVSWNHAELCEKYVQKGTQLYVEGKLRTRSWDDNQGNKRYVTEILAEKIDLLGKKDNNQQQPQQQAPVQQKPQQQYQTTAMPYPTETDDSDLPF
jgi:single-strand DNA-binding protein